MADKIDSYKNILDIYDSLSKQHKKVADYIIANFDEVLVLPIAKVAKNIGVSQPTLIRFSRLIGFKGYPQFRENMLNFYKSSLAPSERMQRYLNGINEKGSIFDTMISSEIEFLKKASLTLSEKDLNDAIEKICAADILYCYGTGPNEALIQYLTFRLNRFKIKVTPISSTGKYWLENFHLITEKDVVLIYKFYKPTKSYIKMIKFLKEKNIKTILITDIRIIDMVKNIDTVLFAKRGPFGVFLSPIVPLAITNALIIGIAKKLGDKAIESLKELNALRERFFGNSSNE